MSCTTTKVSAIAFLFITISLGSVLILFAPVGASPQEDKNTGATGISGNLGALQLQNAYRFEQNGWIYIHLEGSPKQIGFQHGFLLAPEIADAFRAIKLEDTHKTHRDWDFFRGAARDMLWPRIDAEYQQELTGIAEGLKAHGVAMDVNDLVALNAFEELPFYYVPWLNRQQHARHVPRLVSPGNCSAFIATGNYTRDHQIVMAHNNWTSYLAGERGVIIFDIVPEQGYRILMDGFPGVITSDDELRRKLRRDYGYGDYHHSVRRMEPTG